MSSILTQQRHLHRIEIPARPSLRRVAQLGGSAAEMLLALDQLNELYHDCSEGAPTPTEFAHRVMAWLRIRWRPADEDLARIPRTGPLVVVANHPFGAIEGVGLAAILAAVRGDVKIMANFLLDRVAPLREMFIFVDPFEREQSARINVAPLRQSIRHLRDGGVLAVFPAGEVASLSLHQREIIDPPWSETVARIVRRVRCPVLPIHFDGRNSILFQLLGLVHPRLRTGMLAREVLNKRGTRLVSRIGSPISYRRLENYRSDEQLTRYLRQRTYLLRHRASASQPRAPATHDGLEPIMPAVDPRCLSDEIAKLDSSSLLVDAGDFAVYAARRAQVPAIMHELGRLRELTFRATGEGTGKAIDIDDFDRDYVQLFVWNRRKCEIVGAYRLGPTDEILAARGRRGLYTSTLFDCRSELLRHISPALELGRSFVRQEYQKSFSSLLLLWRGIGQYVVRNPRYRFLFGPVSISNDYQSVSRQLMVSFLKAHHCPPEMVDLVQARNPFRLSRIAGWDRSAFKLIRDSDDVSDLVSELEPESKGLPVLLRQYLKLGAKLLAFNVDPAFADCVDALMVVDLSKTDARMLDRYMGAAGRESFLAYHAARALPARRIDALMAQ